MPTCPKCKSTVARDAIICPKCQTTLKAYGHPGMTLYQAEADEFLCVTCAYDADDSCNFPKRPKAKTCTLYQKIGAEQMTEPVYTIPWWRKINRFWMAIALLLAISLLIAFL